MKKCSRAENMSEGEAKGIFMEDQREMGPQSWVEATAGDFFFFCSCGMWDLSSPTDPSRLQGGSQSKPLDHQGIPMISCLVGKLA